MRVLHFAQNVAGGISSYFDEIALYQLEQYGEENVMFFLPHRDLKNLSKVPSKCVRTFGGHRRNIYDLSRLLYDLLSVVNEFKPDIVHLHSTFAGAIGRTALMLTPRRPKIVYCPHGWAFARSGPVHLKWLYAALEKALMNFTDACVNISHSEMEIGSSYGISVAKSRVIRNGISEVPVIGNRELNLTSASTNFLFVGRHDPQKGLDILLSAMERIAADKLHLFVIGEPVVTTKAKISYPELANVTYLGARPREEVMAHISVCDALVVPSRWEGFGLVVTEAMRAGKAVFASNRGALPELVEDGVTGKIIDIDDVGVLAHQLVSTSKAILHEMGNQGKNRFLELYTSARMNVQIADLYSGIAE